jgi:hypothetical protein
MSSTAQPIATLTANVYASWVTQLQNMAAAENAAALAKYQQDLANWKLNASYYQTLGAAAPAQPQPPMTVAVNLNAAGQVLEPQFITTNTPVCPPPAPVAPAPTPTPGPGLGAPMGAGFFAVKVGDTEPNGYKLNVGGVIYVKHVNATPFGTVQYYKQG